MSANSGCSDAVVYALGNQGWVARKGEYTIIMPKNWRLRLANRHRLGTPVYVDEISKSFDY